jgi:hypothetical protein
MPQDSMRTVLDSLDRGAMLSAAQELIKSPSFKTAETTLGHLLGDYFRQRGYEVLLQVTDMASANHPSTIRW